MKKGGSGETQRESVNNQANEMRKQHPALEKNGEKL